MSKAHSPTRFNSDGGNFYDSSFSMDINKRMQVPKSIRMSGDYSDDNITGTNGSSWNQMLATEKFEMHVPERILVAGQDQHLGTKAPLREIVLENSTIPPEPGMIRVQTPPRVLTLDDHFFPAVDEEDPASFPNSRLETQSTMARTNDRYNDQVQVVRRVREQTPGYNSLDISLPAKDEHDHLRRQVGKLTRRILAVELEMQQRQQRDKILYAVALSYFFLKTFIWLSRN